MDCLHSTVQCPAIFLYVASSHRGSEERDRRRESDQQLLHLAGPPVGGSSLLHICWLVIRSNLRPPLPPIGTRLPRTPSSALSTQCPHAQYSRSMGLLTLSNVHRRLEAV